MYNILSLDGGGSWAVIQAECLKDIYGPEAKGRQVLKDFDLVTANSGGSLVLAGLLMDLKLSKITTLFSNQETRRRIFKSARNVKQVVGLPPAYEATAKREGIKEVFAEVVGNPGADLELRTLQREIRDQIGKEVECLIIGFDYDKEREKFFRSRTDSAADDPKRATEDELAGRYTLLDAVDSSTNAPVLYFDGPAKVKVGDRRERYWDGAVSGFNNPCLAGLTEAVANGHRLSEIKLFSIGTASKILPHERYFDTSEEEGRFFVPKKSSGFIRDATKMSTSILAAPPSYSDYISWVMLNNSQDGNESPVIRLNPMVSPVYKEGQWTLPEGLKSESAKSGGLFSSKPQDLFESLNNIDMDAVEQEEVNDILKLAEEWLRDRVANEPIRADKYLKPADNNGLMGYSEYSKAKAKWIGLLK